MLMVLRGGCGDKGGKKGRGGGVVAVLGEKRAAVIKRAPSKTLLKSRCVGSSED